MKKVMALLVLCAVMLALPTAPAAAQGDIGVIVNGRSVAFTADSGYPYIDENFRTMVPLRATMEAAGAAVGYDPATQTAIVITENSRIEVPLGTDYLYSNNKKIENDTVAVAKNGRTYLPIRAVLEAAGYKVEWNGDSNCVIANSFSCSSEQLVPYHTSSLATLVENILAGNVVCIDGQYYATPEHVRMLSTVQLHYSGDDLNTAIYPQADRYSLADVTEEDYGWVSGLDFRKSAVHASELDCDVSTLEPYVVPDFYNVYGFYENGKFVYCVNEMTDAFMEARAAEGVFNGIHMKREDGALWYDYQDLTAHGIPFP